ncbi:Mss4p nuclear export [Coemansia sp. RSA 486]|nr:Mss4p nuclear export [Coemansia sp. RSA 486]
MEELGWAKEDGKPVDYDYYLILAPMYRETEAINDDDDDDEEQERVAKKSKLEIDAYVHPEDEFIEEFAQFRFDYKFTRSKRAAESRDAFAETGLAPSRRCLVVEKSKIDAMVKRLLVVLAP